jgi:hypothetical protein
MLHSVCPSQAAVAPQLQRKRSTAPTPFVGLTQRPHCALCAHETKHPKPQPPSPPAPMALLPRRPRGIDTSMPCCPQAGCDYPGWLGLGNLRANGHPRGGPWRHFDGTACEGYVLATPGTLVHGTRGSVELLVRVLACLAEGVGIRATARVGAVAPHPVWPWRVEAAEPLHAFSTSFLCDVPVRQLQLDALDAVVRGGKAGESSAEPALQRLARSRHWVWPASAPESTWLLAMAVGPRPLAMAQRVVHHGGGV